jgi:hypothetical protein
MPQSGVDRKVRRLDELSMTVGLCGHGALPDRWSAYLGSCLRSKVPGVTI